MMLKSQIFFGDLGGKKNNFNYCLQTGAVVKDGAHDQTQFGLNHNFISHSLTFTIKDRLASDINEPTNPFGPLVIMVNCL